MNFIRYTSTLKATGDEYKKIVFWNRFLRNKTELVVSFLPLLLGIVMFYYGFNNTFFLLVYLLFLAYPIFVYSQLKSAIRYHLKHRDPSEDSPCILTFMENGILAEIEEFDTKYIYHWNEFTTIYDKLGYYMMFQKGKMIVMLRKADIPEDLKTSVVQYIINNVDQNNCVLKLKNQ